MRKLFAEWASHFDANDWTSSPDLPWKTAPVLPPEELRLIAPPLRQFQLGEYARGRTLYHEASAFADSNEIANLPESTRAFIQEEQRHSAVLGRFLGREGVTLLERDPVNWLFRRLRKLAGFELIVTVLCSAECVSVPYYSALRDLTSSELLRKICQNILRDEALHLCYQGYVLSFASRGRGFWSESLVRTAHRLFVLGTGLVVYFEHRKFFRAAKMPLEKFLGSAFQSLAQIENRTGAGALVGLGWLAQGRP